MNSKDEQERMNITIPLAIALAACLGEGAMSYFLFKGWVGMAMFLVGHLALSMMLSSWPLWAAIRQYDLKLPLLFLILTAVMGIFGAGICVVITLLYALYSRHSTSFADWYATLFPEDAGADHNMLYERLMLGWDDFSEKNHPIPYMDIITLGTDHQKATALNKITRHFSPELAPVLVKALDDKSNAIRVQAASVLAKLEQGFSQTALGLEKKIAKHSGGVKLIKLVLQLAQHYDTYAHAGFIIDKDREYLLRNKAIQIYERYLELNPQHKEVYFYLGRLYLKNRNIEEAYALLSSHMEDNENPSPAAIWCYIECLYHKRDYDTIKRFAKSCFPRLNLHDSETFKVIEMIRLWGGGIMDPNFSKDVAYE